MDKYNYHFFVSFCDEVDGEMKNEDGYVIAESYADAMTTIARWYGDGNIVSIGIVYMTDSPILVFGDETKRYENEHANYLAGNLDSYYS